MDRKGIACDNLVVTLTNLYAVRAIMTCINSNSYLNALLLSGAMTSSIIYHALENAKHNMTGIPQFKRYELIALNFDRLFAVLVVTRFIMLYHKKINQQILTLAICSLVCMLLSECQHVINLNSYSVRYTKLFYIITHCLWHIGAFHVAYLLTN